MPEQGFPLIRRAIAATVAVVAPVTVWKAPTCRTDWCVELCKIATDKGTANVLTTTNPLGEGVYMGTAWSTQAAGTALPPNQYIYADGIAPTVQFGQVHAFTTE